MRIHRVSFLCVAVRARAVSSALIDGSGACGGVHGVFVACFGEFLCEGRTFTENWTFPVDDVDGDDEKEGNAGEDCACVFEMVGPADI